MVQNITSKDILNNLKEENSILIDVRTKEEWDKIGIPDLSSINKSVIFISWKLLPNMSINENFQFDLIDEIKKVTDAAESEINLFFLCRSGMRSMESALFMSDLEYNCFNIEKGFEGDPDNEGNRANINGWKFNNNPWKLNS
jgi:rhodanese-related sulfurtransferase